MFVRQRRARNSISICILPTLVCVFYVTVPLPRVSSFVKLNLLALSWGGECYTFGTSMSGRECSMSHRVCSLPGKA